MFVVEDGLDIRQVDSRVDQREENIGELGSDGLDARSEQKSGGDDELAHFGRGGQVRHIGGGIERLDGFPLSTELDGGSISAGEGQVVEVLVTETSGVGDHGGDNGILAASAPRIPSGIAASAGMASDVPTNDLRVRASEIHPNDLLIGDSLSLAFINSKTRAHHRARVRSEKYTRRRKRRRRRGDGEAGRRGDGETAVGSRQSASRLAVFT